MGEFKLSGVKLRRMFQRQSSHHHRPSDKSNSSTSTPIPNSSNPEFSSTTHSRVPTASSISPDTIRNPISIRTIHQRKHSARSTVTIDPTPTQIDHVETSQPTRSLTSGGASVESNDINTLDSSAWTLPSAGVPTSSDLKPSFVLEEPTPDQAAQSTATETPVADTVKDPAADRAGQLPEPSRQLSSESTMPPMVRKVWVKRNGTAPTLVLTKPDDLVDEIKEMVLRRYGNSLGKQFDAPDVTMKLVPRDHPQSEHILSPDEVLWDVLDKAFPGGQKMDEALLVHVPQKRTPKASPGGHLHHHHHHGYYLDDNRPLENGTDYFPPMPPVGISPGASRLHDARAMTVLTTGEVPPLISPGGSKRTVPHRNTRPGFARHNTASPIALSHSVTKSGRGRHDSSASERLITPIHTTHPTRNTPPIVEQKPTTTAVSPRVSSPKPGKKRTKKLVENTSSGSKTPTLPPSFIDTAVPPINILIVEDNIINMKLLEQFVRRLKVHWATAVNGREAVEKWRQGGFHLVLMDIQLPIMSGLEATREIRRLERSNHIGVLSGSSHSSVPPELSGSSQEETEEDGSREVIEADRLKDVQRLFKSPVIIVALTASNLQSDRHEALAAGCNDFLTKPVNFAWFERKVKEWGCMQALIDFDGWRKWKDAAIENGLKDASTQDLKSGSLRRRKAILKKEDSSEETVTAAK